LSVRTAGWAGAAVATAALWAGCAIGPDYVRPVVSSPAEFRGQVTPAEATSLADLAWWEVFGDPALQGLIREAIAANYDLRIATARVQQARAQAGVAFAAYFPSIGYSGKVQRSKEFAAFLGISNSPVNNELGASNLFLGALTATWELDVWGAIRRANEAAIANLLGTEEGRRGVMLSLVSDVAEVYFELVELDARLDIARSRSLHRLRVALKRFRYVAEIAEEVSPAIRIPSRPAISSGRVGHPGAPARRTGWPAAARRRAAPARHLGHGTPARRTSAANGRLCHLPMRWVSDARPGDLESQAGSRRA